MRKKLLAVIVKKMVDEWDTGRIGGIEAAQIRDHVLANLDAYLYQLSEKIETTWWACFLLKRKKKPLNIFSNIAKEKKAKKNSQSQINGDGRNWLKPCIRKCRY